MPAIKKKPKPGKLSPGRDIPCGRCYAPLTSEPDVRQGVHTEGRGCSRFHEED